jgi:hypothetical protein
VEVGEGRPAEAPQGRPTEAEAGEVSPQGRVAGGADRGWHHVVAVDAGRPAVAPRGVGRWWHLEG